MQNRIARISKYKMINFDDNTKVKKIKDDSNRPYIPDHPFRILITGGSGSGKTHFLI